MSEAPLRGLIVIGLMVVLVAAGCGSEPQTVVDGEAAVAALSGAEPFVVSLDRAWRVDAMALRGSVGSRFVMLCPPGGSARSIWGTGTYSDDSSICTAAVHAGAIGFEDGGQVVFEIRPGESRYRGSQHHGVASSDWGSWHGSFIILGAVPLTAEQLAAIEELGDEPTADDLVGQFLDEMFDRIYGDD